MTRAEKKLDPCDEECHFNGKGKCNFGIRHLGCALDTGSLAYAMVKTFRGDMSR